MNIDCRNWIAGQWVEGPDTAENTCPADVANVLGTRPVSGADEANAAIAAAKAAYPAWRDTPAPKRGEYLFKLVRLLERDQERLAEVISMEEGKIIAEARGEVAKTTRYVEFAAGDARRMTGITAPSEIPGTFGMTIWRPLGVVGLITPWNFPICIPLWKIAPAIAAGNTVVLKPAPETPATAHLIGKLIAEAGFPPGVVNIVHGDVVPASTIIEHPDVAAISFTGSTDVGRIIEARCGALHKPVQCELGGKNPILVFSDADIDLAAGACATGAFGSTGQRCTATSRAIVMSDVADEFVAKVLEHAESVVAGHPLDENTTMGPSVSDKQLEQVLKYMEIGRGESELLCGGSRLMEGNLAGGYFPAPTLFDHVSSTARIATEEIFGPVLSVIRVNSVDEAVAAANGVKFGLTGSVFTRDISHAFRVINELEVGMTHINNPTIGGEAHMPFGGIKATGVGPREMGPDAWKFYAESKTVYINHAPATRSSNLF
jgi:aldehyde dehydrogenase (NAD+)